MLCLPCVAVALQICNSALGAPPPSPSSPSSIHIANTNLSLPFESTIPSPANPLPPQKEVIYHIPGEDVVITFSNYHRTISPVDTSICLQQAAAECLRSFSMWNLPITEVVKAYVSNSVTLSLYPRSNMLWKDWIVGVRGVEWFVFTYAPVSMLFAIDVTGRGNVGHGAFTSMYSNATTSIIANSSNVPNLPRDPFTYSGGQGFRVVFKHYQQQISVVDIRNCADHAMYDAYTKSKGQMRKVGGLTYYTSDGVYLIVVPGKNMMWQDLLHTAEAIMGFTFNWDAVALQFDVLVAGTKVGAGILTDFGGVAELGSIEALGSSTV